MSIEICICGKIIDTDEDENAYVAELPDCTEIALATARCPSCREDIVGLMELREKSEQFTQDIFDWVRCIGDVAMLDRMYEFRSNIDKKINQLKGEDNA